jgi:hypothetical protein
MDERDEWRVPDKPWWEDMLKLPPASIASFKAIWGVDYDVIMGPLRQNARESIARAALFEEPKFVRRGPRKRLPVWLCGLLGGHRRYYTFIDSARLIEASLNRTVHEVDPRLYFTLGFDHVVSHAECRRCGRRLD